MKLSRLLLISAVLISFTSCDDLFEPALENNQDISQMYKDPTFARGLLDNAYLALPYSESPSSDAATDDAVINQNGDNYKKMATGSWAANMNPVSQWDGRYHAIQYCNLMLENCDKVEWAYSSKVLNQMFCDNYKGNAYALRGLHMFYLLRAHAGMVDGQLMGVPIHLSSENSKSDFNLPRNTFKECVDQIMSDFDEALKYLPEQYVDVDENGVPAKYVQLGATNDTYNHALGSIHRGKIDGRIISAFKAQLAIMAASPAYASANVMSYEDAAKYAADCLQKFGGLDAIDPNGWNWFANTKMIDNLGATSDNPKEIIWRANVSKSHSLESDNYPPSLFGSGKINPTQNLVDAFPMANGYPISDPNSEYDAKDPYANRDPRLKAYILCNGDKIGATDGVVNTAADSKTIDGLNRENGKSTKTGYYMRKLLRADVNLNPSSTTDMMHLTARIRTTEILLDYAEAANEAQGPKANVGGANYSAYDVIKAIRERAGLGEFGEDPYLEECAQSKDKMRELIRNERRLELCFENHRFWDLRRWKANLNEAAKGINITTDATTGEYIYKTFDAEERKYSDYMYYGPIPYSEILKYSNLKQNEGWK
ncbi:RagB/SusD family nutrient uptake outer membrane protein [Segatella copri]|uniref:RagB/SusD family nutrient uptake outer membrane protein n=1 Tax=Segatella copri TaxID=165179 RepID=UPI0025FF2384|nr:RagB/SusD family nutrient uptake outer membrane protein [Segatella copri]MDV3105662.1 RagB/SusD family nutrient uptake outer membrane protein [Segatella copri]MDV3112541.1 RagB/SusD family nutrient uptake outer membrane protein [Segatella copri]